MVVDAGRWTDGSGTGPLRRGGPVLGRRAMLAGSLALAATGLAGCGFSGTDEPSGTDTPGSSDGRLTDTLREARRPANHLNPAFKGGGSPQSTILMAMMWEGLTRRDPADTSNYLPGVAESWDIAEGGLEYTFHLRDTTWTNGDPLTAEDFVWTFSYCYSPKLEDQGNENPVRFSGINSKITGMPDYAAGRTDDFATVGVTAPDPRTLVVTLAEPDPFFLDSTVEMVPLHRTSVEADVAEFWLPDNYVGNGPYALTAYSQNSNATFELNDKYWDARSFTVRTREIQFNSSGATGMMVSYNADEIDTFRVDGDPAALISGRKDLAEQLVRGTLVQYKGLSVMPGKNPILRDTPELRHALALALDREKLAEVSPPDVAGPSFVPKGVAGADQLPTIPFDVDKAKQLLADAGHPDGKGVPPLSILTYATMPVLEAVAQMWQDHLGLTVHVAVKDVGVYSQMVRGKFPEDFVGLSFRYIAPRPINIIKYGATADPLFRRAAIPYDVNKQIYAITRGEDKDKYSKTERAAKVDELTSSNWTPEYEKYAELNRQAQQAFGDLDKAADLATKAAIALQESYFYIPLLWAGYTFMMKPRIKDLVPTSYPDDIYTLKGVTLDPAE